MSLFTVSRTTAASLLVAAALTTAACGDDTVTTPDTPTPTQITETFADTLTPNGGRTHPFTVQQTGAVSATLASVSGEGTAVGLSLGTWNGAACQIIIANDNLLQGQAVTGSANGTGQFCVRIYDVGKLTQAVDYSITLTHF